MHHESLVFWIVVLIGSHLAFLPDARRMRTWVFPSRSVDILRNGSTRRESVNALSPVVCDGCMHFVHRILRLCRIVSFCIVEHFFAQS